VVQVDPIKPTLKAPRSECLKLKCDGPLLKFDFNLNLRRYSLARAYTDVLKPYWTETILPAQGLLEDEKYFEPILAMVPDAAVRERVGQGLTPRPHLCPT